MNIKFSRFRGAAIALIVVSLVEAAALFVGPIAVDRIQVGDAPFLALVVLSLAAGWVLLGAGGGVGRGGEAGGQTRAGRVPGLSKEPSVVSRRMAVAIEILTAGWILLFVFRYIFAANAGMDYVQRFIESGGNLRLALDTRTERAIAMARYLPPVAVLIVIHLMEAVPRRRFDFLLTLLSVVLTTLSFPSAVNVQGIGVLGWVSLTPLLVVLWRVSYGRVVLYGVTYGILATVLSNYWLGTFSLVSLLAVVLIYLAFYLVFMVPFGGVVVLLRDTGPMMRVTAAATAWMGFELLRSAGFLGYPWVLVGHSQYTNLPLVQIAEFTGVWGVSFVVVAASAALAELFGGASALRRRDTQFAVGGTAAVVLAVHLVGAFMLMADNRYPEADETPRVALIQQNSDPRKHEYERTFATLRDLTDRALEYDPDIVVWSETAFVPNIRRWGEEDPERYRLARLVREFREYQAGIDTWLLTGNDDYRRVFDEEGREVERLSYNAAVLFSDIGERVETYHKVRLVPFTEYFPFEEELPFVYEMLKDFDVAFWEPGVERTVFEHPMFTFSTPICFEDVFPGEVRKFVLEGAEVILNITNDYWSLTEVQAQQHFAGSLFRAVENRRPMLRATASGVTAHVDPYGRIMATRPQYREEILVTDVPVSHAGELTVYTRWGDWFPVAAVVVLAGIVAVYGFNRIAERNGKNGKNGR